MRRLVITFYGSLERTFFEYERPSAVGCWKLRSLSPLCHTFCATCHSWVQKWMGDPHGSFVWKFLGIRKSSTYDYITFGLVKKLRLLKGLSLFFFCWKLSPNGLGVHRRANCWDTISTKRESYQPPNPGSQTREIPGDSRDGLAWPKRLRHQL